MDYIKSKFTKHTVYYIIPFVLIFALTAFYAGVINIVKDIQGYLSGGELDSTRLFILVLVCFGFPITIVNVLKIRYYIIWFEKLKYFSIWHPFGKTLYFDNYIGKIILTEKGSQGSYSVIYLVDKKSKTAFKIVGLHYKKFGEIINAIPLRKMDYSPTTSQYFKLVYFERIKITETGSIPDNDRSVNKALNAIQVFAVIGVGLFILGMIIKMIAKLGG
jgi:hypothetical protein